MLRDGRYRCAHCRYDWKPGRLPLRLALDQWRAVLRWFVRGLPSARIAEETRLDRKRVLRALTTVRRAMTRAAPAEVRRAALSGLIASAPVTPGRARLVTIELYAMRGHVWAGLMPDTEAELFAQVVREKKYPPWSVPPVPYRVGVVHRGRLYRMTESVGGRPLAPFGQIEAFWAYLQRQLRSKGGIRRARIGLYLAEYGWRYNHRKLSPAQQLRELLALIRDWSAGGASEPFPPGETPANGPLIVQI